MNNGLMQARRRDWGRPGAHTNLAFHSLKTKSKLLIMAAKALLTVALACFFQLSPLYLYTPSLEGTIGALCEGAKGTSLSGHSSGGSEFGWQNNDLLYINKQTNK